MNFARRDSFAMALTALGFATAGAASAQPKNPRFDLEAQVWRLADIHDIQNVMGRYASYDYAGLHDESVGLFAQKAEGVKLEIADLGIYDGLPGVKRFYLGLRKAMDGDRKGRLNVHTFTTPVIEIAGDRKTAKGLWISPGIETAPTPAGDVSANWAWIKYGVDFIREDEDWKIWHMHVYRIFRSPPGETWAQADTTPARKLPPAVGPDRPNSYAWRYDLSVATDNMPAAPTPYAQWNEDLSYVR